MRTHGVALAAAVVAAALPAILACRALASFFALRDRHGALAAARA